MPARHRTAGVALMGGALLLAGCASNLTVEPGPSAGSITCAQLLAELPTRVRGLPQQSVTPRDASAVAWGDPSVILRCGVAAPAALQESSALEHIDGVAWFAEPESDGVRYTTVGRTVGIEVTVPDEYGPGAAVLQEFAAAIGRRVTEDPTPD